MTDRIAVEEIRWALEWMQRHAPFMSGPGHVTDREDAAIFAKRALARLGELPTPEAIAESDANAHRLELRLGTIRMYLENPESVDVDACAKECGVFRAVVKAIATAKQRGHAQGRADERADVIAEWSNGGPRGASDLIYRMKMGRHVGAFDRAKGGA